MKKIPASSPNPPRLRSGIVVFKKELIAYERHLIDNQKTYKNKAEASKMVHFTPKNVIIREIYRHVQHKLLKKKANYKNHQNISGKEALLIRLREVYDFKPQVKANPFNYIMIYLNDLETLRDNQAGRSKYARCLSYAFNHDIDPIWLKSFIEICGGVNVTAQKFLKHESEDWIDSRVGPLFKLLD